MKLLFFVFLFSFLIQQIYHWFVFRKFSFGKSTLSNSVQNTPISIVVCGKNEAENFKLNLPKLAKQTYKTFEIVVVDDHSTDATVDVLQKLKQDIPNLLIVNKEGVVDKPGKKHALYAGIQAAKYERIVVTDADCYPSSENWLQYMVEPFQDDAIQLVLGLGPNNKQLGFWIGFFRFETYLTAAHYIGFAKNKFPYMGVGRNMAYTKQFYLNNCNHLLAGDLASGDDDLLVNFGADGNSTAVVIHEDAWMLSQAPQTLKSWWRQKTRHLSAGFQYNWLHKLLLSLLPLTAIVVVISGIILLFTEYKFAVALLLLFQWFSVSFIHNFGLQKMNAKDLFFESVLYYFMWCFITPILAIASRFKSKTQWN